MKLKKIKIGLLTSSRADYGIYQALIDELIKDETIQLEIIAFGTHLSKMHGYTFDFIRKHVSEVMIHKISSLLTDDDQESIASAYALTTLKFAAFWKQNSYDVVYCLGDRFEMSAAVQAGVPFGVKFAHLHGGETTLGAIDNIYRHQITLASTWHFTSTEAYKNKVIELIGTSKNVHDVGALSLDTLSDFVPTPALDFYAKYSIQSPFVLLTFHPETVSPELNIQYANEMFQALDALQKKINLVITMPNADTLGSVFREKLIELKSVNQESIVLIENFGKQNYFTAMQYCKFMIGNTSSGIIEAASFHKRVINVGNRQLGRATSENCITVPFKASEILSKAMVLIEKEDFLGKNIYFRQQVATQIIKHLK